MFGDSYVFVVFQDGTDLYWARSRVTEYLGQIAGRLPENVHPAIGPDATGAGWVYEYAIVIAATQELGRLRALQDWYLRYQLETVPGVAEVASIGGFVRQYQVNLDPKKTLLPTASPPSTVIDRVRQSTNEVGGDVLDMNGAEYMIRGSAICARSPISKMSLLQQRTARRFGKGSGHSLFRSGCAAGRG